MQKNRGRCFIFKVDFEVAYDSVNLSFLNYMMGRFQMDEMWKTWIKECVWKGDLSVLVNGNPTDEVRIQKGLKQGDPLTPFLFLMIAEGLTGLMQNAVALGLFKGFMVGNNGEEISILQYADDNLLVGEATWKICGQ